MWMRCGNSGLAHLLSISGLHVSALIAGVVLILYRILALSPRVALLRPLMLIASGGGALAGISYTLFTGAQVPTVRSCIAALLVLGGLALGREAISLRLVAVGALVVLLFWPEALMGPSFQMSFMAVTVIVALVDSAWFRAHFFRAGGGVAGADGAASCRPVRYRYSGRGRVDADRSCALPSGGRARRAGQPRRHPAHHPRHHAHGAGAALALDLAGAGAPMWWVAGKALALLLGVAHAVAASPWAVWALPPSGMTPLVLVLLGALWLMLWSSGARFAGVPLIALGVAMALRAPAPDLLVTGDGGHMAVRQPDGSLALLRDGAGDYIRETLGKAAGVKAAGGRNTGGRTCRGERCGRDSGRGKPSGRDGCETGNPGRRGHDGPPARRGAQCAMQPRHVFRAAPDARTRLAHRRDPQRRAHPVERADPALHPRRHHGEQPPSARRLHSALAEARSRPPAPDRRGRRLSGAAAVGECAYARRPPPLDTAFGPESPAAASAARATLAVGIAVTIIAVVIIAVAVIAATLSLIPRTPVPWHRQPAPSAQLYRRSSPASLP
jgi:ComEC/Rec2-related protein